MPSEARLAPDVVLARAVEVLSRGGVAEPRREALRLWRDLADHHPAELVLSERPVEATQAARYLEAARRRGDGEPLAHVTGWAGFRHLELRSDGRALIPRPETEGLVDLLLARVRRGRVADLGTGSGALALSLAQEGEFTQVVGIDLSAKALQLAAENRELTGLEVELVRGDFCSPLADGSLDALVSNPPYLTEGEYAALDRSVRDWEPDLALAGGVDGMTAIRRLLDDGRRVLRHGGWIALEVDCTRAGYTARRARELGWADVAIHADLFGRERYLLARRSATT
jgi:release factor glutamine methyltransferase